MTTAETQGTTPEDAFWAWLKAHASDLAAGDPEAGEELRRRLRQTHPYLSADLVELEGGTLELVITADGIVEAFPAVTRLVAKAPEIEGWHVTAFRPRRSDPLELEIGGLIFTEDHLWFEGHRSGDTLALRLYHTAPHDLDEEVLLQAAFFLIDHAVGEYEAATRLGEIEMHAAPDDPAAQGLRPFSAFQAWFDETVQEIEADEARGERERERIRVRFGKGSDT